MIAHIRENKPVYFAADYGRQHCPLLSAALPTIVGSIADHRQHQEMFRFLSIIVISFFI